MKVSLYAVDRFAGGVAILIGDDGSQIEMPSAELPAGLKEGSVIRVQFQGLRPDWDNAVLDLEEEKRRREQARAALERMKRSDPGGDIQL